MTRPSDVNEGINQALEATLEQAASTQNIFDFASPESSAAQTGNTGTSATASVEVPEVLTDGVIFDEHLALALDEGQNSSNAWRLHDHINHGIVHCGLTIENIVASVIRVEERGKPELAEVER